LQNVEEIQNSLSYFLMDLDKLQGKRKAPSNSIKQSWRPPEDFYKTNSDGAFHLETKSGECGFVVRNSLGYVLLAAAGNIAHDTSDIKTKAIAVFKSIQQTTELGMQRIILEMDVSSTAIRAWGVDRSPITCLVNQIRDMRLEFSSCIISVCNKVADGLAIYGVSVLIYQNLFLAICLVMKYNIVVPEIKKNKDAMSC
jgi:hypothetical protein